MKIKIHDTDEVQKALEAHGIPRPYSIQMRGRTVETLPHLNAIGSARAEGVDLDFDGEIKKTPLYIPSGTFDIIP